MSKIKPEYIFRTVESAAISVNIPKNLLSMQNIRVIDAMSQRVLNAFSSLEKAVATRNKKQLLRMKYGKLLPEDITIMEARRIMALREFDQLVSLILKPNVNPEDVWCDLRYLGIHSCNTNLRWNIYVPNKKVVYRPVETVGDVYRVMFGTRNGNAAFLKAHPECNFKTRYGS